MIRVKHFKEERTEKPPKWEEVERFLNGEDLDEDGMASFVPKAIDVISICAYPTGPDHNLVMVYRVAENTV